MSHHEEGLTIERVLMGPYANNGYIVYSPTTREGVIIDAPAEPEKLLAKLDNIKVKAIVLTHGLDTTIGKSKEEYRVFASRPHPPELFGDVRWL